MPDLISGFDPTVPTLRIDGEVQAAITTAAIGSHPYEACGLLGSRPDHRRVISFYSAGNVSAKPSSSYILNPSDQREIEAEMRKRGELIRAVYHSHPRGRAEPSTSDLAIAKLRPEVIHVIVSLYHDEMRAYRLAADQESFTEQSLE